MAGKVLAIWTLDALDGSGASKGGEGDSSDCKLEDHCVREVKEGNELQT